MKTLTLTLSAAALALGGAGVALADNHKAGRGGDANGDGVVTRAEHAARSAAMFARMDANGDGVINAADREARKAERFARLDADGNGEVSPAEMQAAREARQARMQERRAERSESRTERRAQSFAALDTDNSGGVSQAEMDAARSARGDGAKRAMRGHGKMGGMGLMRGADGNADRSITRAQFEAAADARFTAMDTDNSGTVTTAERQAARTKMKAAIEERRAARAGS